MPTDDETRALLERAAELMHNASMRIRGTCLYLIATDMIRESELEFALAEALSSDEAGLLALADEIGTLRQDRARMDWLSQQEMGIKDRGYGDYWYYTGEGFTPLRELCDQEIAGDAARIKEDADD